MIDIDANWNPEECSLDEHRMNMLKTLEQPGFGVHAKQKHETKPVATEVIPIDEAKADDNGP